MHHPPDYITCGCVQAHAGGYPHPSVAAAMVHLGYATRTPDWGLHLTAAGRAVVDAIAEAGRYNRTTTCKENTR